MRVEFRDGLRVRRGKLAPEGVEVHAATYLRERRIVLDRALMKDPAELQRIFVHELCHFVWWKLGNPRRLRWEGLLAGELAKGARGELGWSSDFRKRTLTPVDVSIRNRRWREYCCESFCDTGASIYTAARTHGEFTLAERFRRARERWLEREDIIQSEEDFVQFLVQQNGRCDFAWLDGVPCLFPLPHGKRSVLCESGEGS